jgi:hypothetical protein
MNKELFLAFDWNSYYLEVNKQAVSLHCDNFECTFMQIVSFKLCERMWSCSCLDDFLVDILLICIM